MGKVCTGATMSLDGFIAGPNDTGFDLLFQWYGEGVPGQQKTTSEASAEHLRRLQERTGALVVGRHLYDLTNAWGGRHPMDVTTVVLTHNPPPARPQADDNFVFVTGGIKEAIAAAQKIAGPKEVGVNGGQMARQALEAGLLDEFHVDLVPVLLGAGTPFIGQFEGSPLALEGPVGTIAGVGVTHLRYRIRRP
ncbi:dihydrofolate reductase family protein [Actinoplanes sp. TRM 88003]|uniref:Dihydrofolate reductase family protein n=1 Tax=Paractinoplanes aksuensis TaxID=2939490 RepID=A0ABT1DI28_9ACTN|nr:dihydrofolate reductase family protein [Actinoplanes aksuensis]MCO8270477.1 dihydrofolate reductase family protein [Actinoplanes aksuensis]